MGELYRDAKQYPQAIAAFHHAGKGAESGFAAADCQMRADALSAAILELEAIVGMFKDAAPPALLTMARYYDRKGQVAKRNETLIRLLTGKPYKGTRAWSDGHCWAENLKLDFRGAEQGDEN
jgi:hypothetical protein